MDIKITTDEETSDSDDSESEENNISKALVNQTSSAPRNGDELEENDYLLRQTERMKLIIADDSQPRDEDQEEYVEKPITNNKNMCIEDLDAGYLKERIIEDELEESLQEMHNQNNGSEGSDDDGFNSEDSVDAEGIEEIEDNRGRPKSNTDRTYKDYTSGDFIDNRLHHSRPETFRGSRGFNNSNFRGRGGYGDRGGERGRSRSFSGDRRGRGGDSGGGIFKSRGTDGFRANSFRDGGSRGGGFRDSVGRVNSGGFGGRGSSEGFRGRGSSGGFRGRGSSGGYGGRGSSGGFRGRSSSRGFRGRGDRGMGFRGRGSNN